MSSASCRALTVLRVDVGLDGRPAPDHGDLVGDGQDLVELVGDEDDRQALGLQLTQVVEELGDLLRDQDRGRLVEDEDLGAPEQDLEDLDALPFADAQLRDQDVGVDPQSIGVRDVDDRLARLVADAVQLLRAEDDVLEDGEVVGQHEVLEHHADARVDRVGGAAQGQRLTVHLDRALVGLLDPVEDLHQRRLPRAVLADDGVDGTAADRHLDVLVGHDTGEAFGDAVQFDGRGRATARGARRVLHSRVGDDVLLGACSPRVRLAGVGANL